jgi:hypothetical protein
MESRIKLLFKCDKECSCSEPYEAYKCTRYTGYFIKNDVIKTYGEWRYSSTILILERLGGPQGQSECCGERKNLLPSSGI